MRHAKRCLSKGGFEVQTATNFAYAMSCLDTDISPEVVVTDLHLDNGETGWKIAEFCAERHPSAQIFTSFRPLAQIRSPKICDGECQNSLPGYRAGCDST